MSMEANVVPNLANVVSRTMALDCQTVGLRVQSYFFGILTRSGVDAGAAATTAGRLVMSSLVISRRREGVRIVAPSSSRRKEGVRIFAPGRLVRSSLVISRRRLSVRIVAPDNLGGTAGSRAKIRAPTLRAQPAFNCRTLQFGVAIRTEKLEYVGEGNTGAETCTGVVDGESITFPYVLSGHVGKDLENILLQGGVFAPGFFFGVLSDRLCLVIGWVCRRWER